MIIIGCLLSDNPLIDVLKSPFCISSRQLRCLVMPLIAAVMLFYRLGSYDVPVHRDGAWVQRGDGHQYLRRAL